MDVIACIVLESCDRSYFFIQKQRGGNKRSQPSKSNPDSWYWVHVDIKDFEKKETKINELKWVITRKPPYQIVDENGALNRYDGWYHPSARGPAKANFFFGFQPTQIQRDLLSGIWSNRDLYLHLEEIINNPKSPNRPCMHLDRPICRIIAEYAPIDDLLGRFITVVRCNKQETVESGGTAASPTYIVKTVDTAVVLEAGRDGEDIIRTFRGRGAIFQLPGVLGPGLISADPSRPPGYNSNKRHKKGGGASTSKKKSSSIHDITNEFVWKEETTPYSAAVYALLMSMAF
jgi:hypothetical protein